METALRPGARVAYLPHGWFATFIGFTDEGAARIRFDDATEETVNRHTLEVWPAATLIPRAEIRQVHTDHGSPSFPQIDGDGVAELSWVQLLADGYRESAEDSDRALHLTALADDLDALVQRYEKVLA